MCAGEMMCMGCMREFAMDRLYVCVSLVVHEWVVSVCLVVYMGETG